MFTQRCIRAFDVFCLHVQVSFMFSHFPCVSRRHYCSIYFHGAFWLIARTLQAEQDNGEMALGNDFPKYSNPNCRRLGNRQPETRTGSIYSWQLQICGCKVCYCVGKSGQCVGMATGSATVRGDRRVHLINLMDHRVPRPMPKGEASIKLTLLQT